MVRMMAVVKDNNVEKNMRENVDKNLESLLAQLNEQLEPRYQPGLLPRQTALFQFIFDKGEPLHLHANQKDFVFHPGLAPKPTINLFCKDHDTCRGLLTGQIDGMQAFMAGDYRADGNIVLSQLLLYLFKPDDPAIAYQIQD